MRRKSFLRGFTAVGLFLFVFANAGFSSDTKETKKAAIGMTLQVNGMVCSECGKKVEHCLMKIKGVKKVNVDVDENQAYVEFDAKKVTVNQMIKALKKKGYDAKEKKSE